MRRPPSFPPSAPRQRPEEVEAELAALTQRAKAVPSTPPPPSPAADPPLRGEDAVSTRLRERLEELRGARRRARLHQIGLLTGAILLAGAGAWVVLFSSLLALDPQEVEITGTNDYASAADVRAVTDPYAGVPLARLDIEQVRADLTDNLAIHTATISRQWPTGLTVALDARTPVAATPTATGFTLLDADGVNLGEVTEEVTDLPLVDVAADGEDVPETIAAVLEVMGALPADLLGQVTSVGATNPYEVEFHLEDGARVVWGSAADSELKASVLQVLLTEGAKVYNVAAPMSPITSQ